ncbi:MAG: 16S rRNA (guanine(527)-N(7))-methyltransferase RsmG [Clostridia bacterium]|nr:16S rRNA (guanine(527)-N(7))-methyltransferase RsmG [Clostridia bacterium]
MDTEKYAEIIKNSCSEKFGQFERLLLEYNKKCNLTSITDEKEVFIKHFLDSVSGESFFPQKAEVVEIGSGGGFPSIPLKIVRDDLSFTLIESTGKKCTFLNETVEKLGLNCVQVKNIRAEDGAKDKNLREKFDVACARAVARLNVLCEYCLPYVKVGGYFIAYKGEASEEIKEAENAVKVLGGKIEEVLSFDLPEGGGIRNIIKIKKIKPTPPGYPRGQGRERKNPL